MDRDQLARRLLATLAGELDEQVRALNADLLALEQHPDDGERLQSVFRIVHSLKGAARAAGVPLLEHVCHELEARLAESRRGQRPIAESDFAHLFAAVDAFQETVGLLRGGRDLTDSPLPDLLEALRGWAPARKKAPAARSAAPAQRSSSPLPGRELVRIDALKLDRLLAALGELLVERARMTHGTHDVTGFAEGVAAFAARWRSLGRALRLAAERDRVGARVQQAIGTLGQDVQRLTHQVTQLASAAGQNARRLGAAVDRVAQDMQELRLQPFGEAVEPLARTVRDLAKASGKDVHLEVVGAEVEADRAVLDGLRDALLQLVRNAVDHGIESPAGRKRRGKSEAGLVRVAAALRADRMVVTVSDDGAGLDADRIRAALSARGVAGPADNDALGQALLAGGISTRTEPSTISGRGVGLDVVRDAVERIRGTIRVTWEAGVGTTFTIECPPTLAVLRAVLARVGPHAFAIPTASIVRLARIRAGDIRRSQGRQVVTVGNGPVPLVALARILGPPLAERRVSDVIPVMLLEHGKQHLAVAVEEFLSEEECVLRPVQQEGLPARYVSGVTVLGTGRVAPVLNTAAVVAAGLGVTAGGGLELAEAPAGRRTPRILVVDDSITTRTLEQSVLEAAGYDVVTAVDGADAWRAVQERGCDLVVADVDMPRMDGFDLCHTIRTSKRFKELPVILVTALESPEHRKRGMEVGADAYIGKSGFDQEQLLETVRQLVGAP